MTEVGLADDPPDGAAALSGAGWLGSHDDVLRSDQDQAVPPSAVPVADGQQAERAASPNGSPVSTGIRCRDPPGEDDGVPEELADRDVRRLPVHGPPHPDGPSTAASSPAATSRSAPASAWTGGSPRC